MRDKGWFIALTAMWRWCEIWGIRFKQQAVGGRNTRCFAYFTGLREGGDAAECEKKPQIQALSRLFEAPCKAVHDAGQGGGSPVFPKCRDGVSPCISGVNYDRHAS